MPNLRKDKRTRNGTSFSEVVASVTPPPSKKVKVPALVIQDSRQQIVAKLQTAKKNMDNASSAVNFYTKLLALYPAPTALPPPLFPVVFAQPPSSSAVFDSLTQTDLEKQLDDFKSLIVNE